MANAIRFSLRYRIALFALISTSWTSGIVFFVMNRWITVEGEFGVEKHPWQLWFLKTHGAAAFLMMITFGILLASHVSAGWPVRRMRPVGLALVFALSLLIVTAYGLYYLGDEDLRTYVSFTHFGVGLCIPGLLALHLLQGKRKRKRKLKNVTP